MPFRFTKGLLKRGEKPEPARKPILDEQPKQVPQDVYSLPTLEDLPEMPQPVEEAIPTHEAMFTTEPEPSPAPHRDVAQLEKKFEIEERPPPAPEPRAYQPRPLPSGPVPVRKQDSADSSLKGQISEILDAIRRMESIAFLSGKEDPAHDQIVGLLTGIDRRLADVDRRLAMLERSLGR